MGWPALLWVAAGVAGVGALAAAAGGGGTKSGADDLQDGGNFDGWVPPQKAFVQVEDDVEVITGTLIIDRQDDFSCRKASDQSLPIVGLWDAIPTQLKVGPIAAAIEGGIGVVQGIFSELGWRKVCTVRAAGPWQNSLRTIWAGRAEALKVWVRLSVQFVGHPDNWVWVWENAEVSSTGELTPKGEFPREQYVPGPRSRYLGEGGEPPGNMWPHVSGLAKWRASVPQVLDHPRADVVRAGEDLRLQVWLPPRAPLSRLKNVTMTYEVQRKVRWKIEYAIEKLG